MCYSFSSLSHWTKKLTSRVDCLKKTKYVLSLLMILHTPLSNYVLENLVKSHKKMQPEMKVVWTVMRKFINFSQQIHLKLLCDPLNSWPFMPLWKLQGTNGYRVSSHSTCLCTYLLNSFWSWVYNAILRTQKFRFSPVKKTKFDWLCPRSAGQYTL